MWILVDKYRNPDPFNKETAAAKPIDITMRLEILVLAILPQAIKLFSM
jgi:hypothetical protein